MLISKTLCARARTKAVVLFTVVNCDNKSLARDEGQLSSGKLSFSSCFRVIIVCSTKGHVTCLAVKARQSFWPIFARRKRKLLPGPFWYRQPGRHLPRCLFSPGRSFISRDATENPMARTAAGSRSGMDEDELHGHLSEQLFRAVGG